VAAEKPKPPYLLERSRPITKVSGSIFQPLIFSVGCDPIECLPGKRASLIARSSSCGEIGLFGPLGGEPPGVSSGSWSFFYLHHWRFIKCGWQLSLLGIACPSFGMVWRRLVGPSGEWNDDDFDVLADGIVVGRIFKANAAPTPQTCRRKSTRASLKVRRKAW
jgi:hypothetical protein